MIIDPEVEETLKEAYVGKRKVSKLVRRKNLEKLIFFYETLKGILNAQDYEEALITATIQITAKYGDPFLAKGIQEMAELLKRIHFAFETDFGMSKGSIMEFLTRDPFLRFPPIVPGALELLTAYTDCKPGEHRGAIFYTTKETLGDILFEYFKAMQDCDEGYDCNVYYRVNNLFSYVYGRTKAGEVYVVKIGNRKRKFHEELEKEIQVAMRKEFEKLQKYFPEEGKLLKFWEAV
jgi:hypothetical protein